MGWFSGTPEKHERVSTLLPGQQPLLDQLIAAISGQGGGGAFGQSADYWRQILSDNPELMEQFFAPEKRNFEQNIIPGLSEQFAGMGAGGLSSSGFRNAAVNAGTDLSERLGSIRADLKNQAAQGLGNLGQLGLGNYSQDVMTQQGTGGFGAAIAPALGAAAGSFFGPAGTAAGGALGNWVGSKFGKSDPYGGQRMSRTGNMG